MFAACVNHGPLTYNDMITGAIKAVAELLNTALQKFVKSSDEKRKDDRYRAERDFKEFRNRVSNETKSRTTDLDLDAMD